MRISKNLRKRIEKTVREKIDIVPYDSRWPDIFEKEAHFLKIKFPDTVKRIEHFGSTAVPGLAAKPVVDMLVEVSSLQEVKKKIVPVLTSEDYEYFWRPVFGDSGPPYYAWFIKRDSNGKRTHHIHMVEVGSELWDRLFFRDYLREHPKEARAYEKLKSVSLEKYAKDRVAYTKAKTDFIVTLTKKAKKYYQAKT